MLILSLLPRVLKYNMHFSNSLSSSILRLILEIKSDISNNVDIEDLTPHKSSCNKAELNFSKRYSHFRKFLIFSATGCSYIIYSFILIL